MKTLIGILTLLFALLAVTGCIGTPSAPTRFYMLDAMGGAGAAPSADATAESALIAVAPVQVPEYLNRPQMITRLDRSEYRLDEFSRWMEPLGDNLTRVMVENLAILLQADGMEVVPTERFLPVEHTVEVRALRMHGKRGGEVAAVFRWTLLGRDDALLSTKRAVYRQRAGDNTYNGLAKAHTRIVEALSRDIAEDIRRIAGR
jgi:uncharacterized lipoprotein YmbA